MVNVPPSSSSGFNFPSFARFAKSADGLFDFRKAHPFRVAQDRHDQPAFARNRHADIEIIVIDNVVPANLRIELRELFQGVNDRVHKKRHEAEFDLVTFFKRLLFSFRKACTALMSTSLNVVSIAICCFASTSRLAAVLRNIVIGTISSRDRRLAFAIATICGAESPFSTRLPLLVPAVLFPAELFRSLWPPLNLFLRFKFLCFR